MPSWGAWRIRSGLRRLPTRRIGAFVLAALLALVPEVAVARSHSSRSSSSTAQSTRAHRTRADRRHSSQLRDPEQRRKFVHQHPCPGGPDAGSTRRCRGYVVDHVKPLKRGGADRPSNMQWQTKADAKAKDKWE